MKTLKRYFTILAIAVVGALAVGCGSDDDDNNNQGGGGDGLTGYWKEVSTEDGLDDYLYFDGTNMWDLKYADGSVHYYLKFRYTDNGSAIQVSNFAHYERNVIGDFGDVASADEATEYNGKSYPYSISSDGYLTLTGYYIPRYKRFDGEISMSNGLIGTAWANRDGSMIIGIYKHQIVLISQQHVKMVGWYGTNRMTGAITFHMNARYDHAGGENQEATFFDEEQTLEISASVSGQTAQITIGEGGGPLTGTHACTPVNAMYPMLFGQWLSYDRTQRIKFGLDGSYMICYGMGQQHHWAEAGTYTWNADEDADQMDLFDINCKSTAGLMWNDEDQDWYDAGTNHNDCELSVMVSADNLSVADKDQPAAVASYSPLNTKVQ